MEKHAKDSKKPGCRAFCEGLPSLIHSCTPLPRPDGHMETLMEYLLNEKAIKESKSYLVQPSH